MVLIEKEKTVTEIMKKVDKPKYDIESIRKGLVNIEKALDLNHQQGQKIMELKISMMRIERALQSNFWLDEINWKQKNSHEKIKILREEKCVRFRKSGSEYQDIKDFPFFAKKQWENDRRNLLKTGDLS